MARSWVPPHPGELCGPGVIDTDMNRHLSAGDMDALAEETPGTNRTAGGGGGSGLFSGLSAAGFITGQVLPVDGGMVIG